MGFPQKYSCGMDRSDYILSVFKLEQVVIDSLSVQQMESSTPNSQKNICQPFRSTDIRQDITDNEYHYELAPLNGRTFSFHEPSSSHLQTFCKDFLNLCVLERIGKRITDPNIMLNTTQKETVQTIINTNSAKTDEKSKFLTQRANKYIKILWKAGKYNDAFYEKPSPPKIQREVPSYASPIHNFKKHHKLTRNNSFGSLSNKTDKSRSFGQKNGRSPKIVNVPAIKIEKRNQISHQSSRSRRYQSQDQKFDKIRLSPKANLKTGKVKQNRYAQQKLINIDLTASLAQKTINMTTKFENMLKILKQQQK